MWRREKFVAFLGVMESFLLRGHDLPFELADAFDEVGDFGGQSEHAAASEQRRKNPCRLLAR